MRRDAHSTGWAGPGAAVNGRGPPERNHVAATHTNTSETPLTDEGATDEDRATIAEDTMLAISDQVKDEGWAVVEDAIPRDLCDAIGEDLLRLERELAVAPADNLFEGIHTIRIYNLLAHGPLYERIPVHPNVLPIAQGVLDPGLLVSSLSSIAIGAGESAQPIHADDQIIGLPKPHPPLICNTMWAITDFTEANGATRLCRGTHLANHSPDPLQHYDSIAAEMQKGSVLVWVGSLWHGGGANTTKDRRVGIAMNYCAGFLRQQENQQLGIPREIAKTFSPRLQELVGYSVYNGLIGHIDKQHPGRVVLGDDPDNFMVWDYAKVARP
jgi:ectoine hydroxylase-related dioxygenase (phytanoyl-CoA dioxygenase family)